MAGEGFEGVVHHARASPRRGVVATVWVAAGRLPPDGAALLVDSREAGPFPATLTGRVAARGRPTVVLFLRGIALAHTPPGARITAAGETRGRPRQ